MVKKMGQRFIKFTSKADSSSCVFLQDNALWMSHTISIWPDTSPLIQETTEGEIDRRKLLWSWRIQQRLQTAGKLGEK
jgi:hypothetical protein